MPQSNTQKIESGRTLIIGAGEIGNALFEIFKSHYKTTIIDKESFWGMGMAEFIDTQDEIEAMHICFGWFKGFEKEVKRYQKKYKPKFTIVHSTVPPGTCDRLKVCHSPIRGRLPYMEKCIKTFVKFVGGKGADEAAEYFRKLGIRTIICRKAATTELGKILSTNFQVTCVEFTKEAERLCERYGVPFGEAFTLFNMTYNEAHTILGHPEYIRPTFTPTRGKIGGHCLLPNLDLMDSEFAKFIKKLNEE